MSRASDEVGTVLAGRFGVTPPKSPQTNGMVECFNGRIEEVLQSHHFRSGEELETTLHRYVWLYNQAALAVSPGQQVALAGDEGLAQTQAEAVQEATVLAPGM